MAIIDQDSCESCGICRDERCPMDAIVEDDGEYRVEGERCIGCGVCVVTCSSESITLVDRPESDRDEMAENMIDWGKRRLEERGRHAG